MKKKSKSTYDKGTKKLNFNTFRKCKFEGLSLILKEQLAEIKYLGEFTYPIATFLTCESWGVAKIAIAHVVFDYTDARISDFVIE